MQGENLGLTYGLCILDASPTSQDSQDHAQMIFLGLVGTASVGVAVPIWSMVEDRRMVGSWGVRND